MNDLSVKLNIPLGPSTRDSNLEADLQTRLDAGHRIFAVGDIHGHLATFRALLQRLRLKSEDRVICLGDMIDRGPNSAGLVNLLRSHPQIICIKGNHEQMAIQSVRPNGELEPWQPWMKRGGKSTYSSYIIEAEGDLWKARASMLDDFMWLDTLPTEIVLDRIRLVHAGYDPRTSLESQGEEEMLWIRKEWFTHDAPVDPARTVFFGHTTTTKLGDQAGEIARSSFTLSDGRPAWFGVDIGAYNHVAPGLAAIEIHSLRSVIQRTLRCDRWFAKSGFQSGEKKSKKPWKGPNNQKEAGICESFGLKALVNRARTQRTAALRVQRELEEAGIVFPRPVIGAPAGSDVSNRRGGQPNEYRIIVRQKQDPTETKLLRGPTGFRVYRRNPVGERNTPPALASQAVMP